jgi:hypothetical protein
MQQCPSVGIGASLPASEKGRNARAPHLVAISPLTREPNMPSKIAIIATGAMGSPAP